MGNQIKNESHLQLLCKFCNAHIGYMSSLDYCLCLPVSTAKMWASLLNSLRYLHLLLGNNLSQLLRHIEPGDFNLKCRRTWFWLTWPCAMTMLGHAWSGSVSLCYLKDVSLWRFEILQLKQRRSQPAQQKPSSLHCINYSIASRVVREWKFVHLIHCCRLLDLRALFPVSVVFSILANVAIANPIS